jgi:uncharacterized membrane protein
MDNLSTEHKPDDLQTLKRYAATVYLCQLLTFALAGLPLLAGVTINFFKKDEVKGTWLESHFNWQVNTCWGVLAGFALAGFTFNIGIGVAILGVTVIWMIYRIVIGWHALMGGKTLEDIKA